MRRKNTQMTTNILIVSLLLIGVVYALLQANLQINGIAKILNNTWDVHFDNIQVNENSVSIESGDSAAAIDPENNCKVDFEVTLNLPGDFYEFTIDVVNSGTIDGMIGTLNKTLIINNETLSEVPDYLNYSITYDDGVEIEENHKVSAGTVETYLVRLEFKSDIEELPEAATIVTSLEPQYVQADSSAVEVFHSNRLYNVFAAEYNSGSGLVHEYTGAHKDSFTENGTQKIYHWYAPSGTQGNSQANQILEKNNVIFADHCWQMIRTTDTGGVKLIYNGEVENNQCLDTRGTHVGYSSRTSQTLSSNYWYGTDYDYDSTNNVFRIAGTTVKTIWNSSTGSGLVGKYTCKGTNENDSCSVLYLVESYKDASNAYVIPLNSDSNFHQFGQLQFNVTNYIPSYVGYMYGDLYSYTIMDSVKSQTLNSETTVLFHQSYSNSYYYSKTIRDTGSGYELVNPVLGSDIPEDNYSGYYTFGRSSVTSGSQIHYLAVNSSGSTYYYSFLSYPKQLSDSYIMIGDSISDNLDGTYTLSGTTISVSPSDWYSNYNSYKNKYTCGDATTTTCSNPRFLYSPYFSSYRYLDAGEKIMIGKSRNGLTLNETTLLRYDELFGNISNYSSYKYTCNTTSAICTDATLRMIYELTTDGYRYVTNYYYGSGVTWDGTNYTLISPIEMENYNNLSNLSSHHYFCLNGSLTCESVAYLYYHVGSGQMYYIILQNGVLSVSKVLEDMFSKNTTNSIIKNGIESWYKKQLINYDDFIEDIIYCNNRSFKSSGGWDANTGITNTYLYFKQNDNIKDLSCVNTSDQFSVSNPNARLTYKVGLMTGSEVYVVNNPKIYSINQTYWLSAPDYFSNIMAYNRVMSSSGSPLAAYLSNAYGIRPSISLKPGIKYSEGDGSKEHPYVIKTD